MTRKLRIALRDQPSARAVACCGLRGLFALTPFAPFLVPLILLALVLWAPDAGAISATGHVNTSGPALEVVTGFVTAPSTTFTNWTMATGNSLTIRNAALGKKINLLGAWAQNQVAGTLSVRSPKMHDNVWGIRSRITTTVMPLYPLWTPQILYPQDSLTVQQTGSAVGGQIESGSLLVWYEDLPGATARFIDVPAVTKRVVNILGQETTITAGAGGGYTGQEAVNAQFDNFIGNTDYALLGYETNVQCCTVRIQGVDTSNLGVGGPGDPAIRDVTCKWFYDLSENYGMPLIPVFNSANKQGILVDVVQSQAAAAVIVTWYFAQLSPA